MRVSFMRGIGMSCLFFFLLSIPGFSQIGYYDAPYTRYEANVGSLTNATITTASYNQADLQSEASDQVCVNMTASGASVLWNVTADGDGLVVRYSVPDGQSGVLEVYANAVFVGTLNLTSYYSWEYLSTNGNPNNVGVVNNNPKMRFDEVRMKLPSKILAGGTLRLTRQSGNIHLDFAELEPVPTAVPAAGGDLVYTGNGSDLQNFIDANGGNTIYLPSGLYNVNRELYFGVNNTILKGAGIWYSQIHFTNGSLNQGGLRANASNISYSGLYLTTVRNSRSNSYKAINGVYTAGSTIVNVWAEHFECGAWIGQYNVGGPAIADGFLMSNCRFRNNFADGINLCKGTSNSIVEHCSFRNNGDDDMAIWPANNQSCNSNTYRYNTSENTWRSAGCAIYGGYNNKVHNILIKDNLEVGLKVNNFFSGSPFSTTGLHEFYNIRIIKGSTYQDLFNSAVGAIDIAVSNVAGSTIYNVKFSCIEIIDSKNDAIAIKRTNGVGFSNLSFENITINGTGREYPFNGGAVAGRGYMVLFSGNPGGAATHCGMNYSNRGGSALSDLAGTFTWNLAGSCPAGCSIASASTMITSPISGNSFDGCPLPPITIQANSTAPSGNTVSYVEFFVNGVSLSTDNSFPYSTTWTTPTNGNHTLTAVSYYSPSNSTTTSSSVTIQVGPSIKLTSGAPVLDGTIDALWNNYKPFVLTQVYTNPPDLYAYYKIMYDATYLYVLVDVTDDFLVQDGGGFFWEDDNVEIYLDIGNDKPTTYNANDYHYEFNWNSATIAELRWNATAGVTLAQSNRAGGYVMEMRFPWATIGGSAPSAGSYIGFDIKINDDDNGGTREHQLTWSDATDMAWSNPSLFGSLQFSACSPLSQELILLNGNINGNDLDFIWLADVKSSNQFFILQMSKDLTLWENIDYIMPVSSEDSYHQYNFTFSNFNSAFKYYRVVQIFDNNEIRASNIFNISSINTKVYFTPNPFYSELIINIPERNPIDITFFDSNGKNIYTKNINENTQEFVLSPEIPAGIYFVQVKTNNKYEYYKIVKF